MQCSGVKIILSPVPWRKQRLILTRREGACSWMFRRQGSFRNNSLFESYRPLQYLLNEFLPANFSIYCIPQPLLSFWLSGQHPLVVPFSPNISVWVLQEKLISECSPTHFLTWAVQRGVPVSFNPAIIILDREIAAAVQMSRHHDSLPNFILLLLSQQPDFH